MTEFLWNEICIKLPIKAEVTEDPVIDSNKCTFLATTLLGDQFTGVILGERGKKISNYMHVGRKFLIPDWDYESSSTEEHRTIRIKQIEFRV